MNARTKIALAVTAAFSLANYNFGSDLKIISDQSRHNRRRMQPTAPKKKRGKK